MINSHWSSANVTMWLINWLRLSRHVVYNSVLRAWWPWSILEKSSRHFAVICVQRLQECSFRDSSTLTVGKKGGGRRRRRELDSNLADVFVLEVSLLPPHRWVTAVPVAVSILEPGSLPLTHCGSCYVKQRAPAIPVAVTQRWGGRR